MATLTGKLVADTYKALLKMIDNDVVTATEKQISDGLGGGTGIFIDQDGEIRASKYRVTAGTSSQFLKADGSLDSTSYLPSGTTTTSIPEGSNLYFTNSRVLNTTLNGFTAISGTVTSADSVLTAIEKIWWNIVNGGGGGGGGYVPYVGATQNLNLGEYGLLGGFVQFDTTPTTAPNAVGALSWNDQDGTLDLKLKGGNVTLQIGQEQVTRVVNKTGVNLLESNYQAVRISGAQGNRLKVALAQANNDANSAETLGLVTENINDNNEGFITSSGLVRDINTTGSLQGETWADGDILYLSGTTAGRLTNIKPQAPIHTVIIGFVVRAHATQGAIYVKVDNGYELDELHNVKITAPEDKDFLVYDGTNLYWENRSIYGTEGYLPIYNDTNIFNDSIIYSDGVGIGVGTNILEPTAIATFFGNIDLVTGTYLTSDGFNLIGRGNLINQIEIGSQNASDYLTFIAGNAERARITAAGNFGIGLTNPSAPLHVKGSTYTNVIVDNNSATGGGSYLSYQNGTKKALFGLSGAFELNTGSDVAIASTIAGGGIKFYTNNSTTQAMGIVSSGNAYLGQAPTFLGLGTEFIVRGQASDGVLGVMDSTEAVKGLFISNSSLSWLGTYSNHPLAFRTNNTEWARISSAGNLLIGTIVDNATDKLQVNGTSYFGDNIVLADSKGIVSSGVNMLSRNNLNNQIIIGADGGINDNVAFYSGDLERMRLLANGRLAINKTTASYQVDVQGDVNVSGAFRVNGTIIPNGTVTSVAMSVPTGLVISGSPITSSGTLAVTYAVNYGIPTLTKQSDWDDAYTWITNFPDQLGNSGKFLTTNGSVLSWASLVTGVSSVFGRTGAVVAQSGDYTTAQVTESGNLYYTDARARLALSASAPLSYNNGTGAFSISQASGSTNGFLSSTDWNTFNNKQNALGYTPVPTTRTLTINGTSYDLSADRSWTISAGLSGSGTTNYVSKFTGSTSIGNSLIFDDGTRVGVNTTSLSNTTLSIFDSSANGDVLKIDTSSSKSDIWFNNSTTTSGAVRIRGESNTLKFISGSNVRATLDSSGNLGLGVTPSAWTAGGSNIEVGAAGNIIQGQAVQIAVIQNATFNAGWKYSANGFASFALQTSGQHQWFTAPSGTAGNAISFTQAMTLDASGNLTIGNTTATSTTSPKYISLGGTYGTTLANGIKLKIFDSNVAHGIGAIAGNLYLNTGDVATYITFNTNNTENVRINNGGNVSIGNTNNTYKLDVSGTGYFNGNASTTPAVIYNNANGASGTAQYYANYTSGATVIGRIFRGNGLAGTVGNGLNIDNYDGFQVRLNQLGGTGGSFNIMGGNVGIGTTSPSTALHVIGAGTFSSSVTAGGFISTDSTTVTSPIDTGSTKAYISAANINGAALTLISDSVGRTLRLSSNTSGTSIAAIDANSTGFVMGTNTTHPIVFTPNATERMRITTAGNVGIGTTSPSNGLLVINSTSATGVRFALESSGTMNGIVALGNNAISGLSTTDMALWTRGVMAFETGASGEKMRITSGGQIYMGNSAGDGYRLQIFGTNQAGSTFGQTYIGVAAYSQWVNSSGAFVMGLDGASGTTERMRITSQGRLLLGTTSSGSLMFEFSDGANTNKYTTLAGNLRAVGRITDDLTNVRGIGFGYSSAENLGFIYGTSNGTNTSKLAFLIFNGSTWQTNMTLKTGGTTLNIGGIPSSNAGLVSGDVYKDANGFLKIV